MLKEFLIQKALDEAYAVVKRVLKGAGAKFINSNKEIEDHLSHHLKSVIAWAEEVNFNDLKQAKKTSQIFIELDTFVYPRRLRVSPNEKINKSHFLDIFEGETRNFIILGQPGAGKTTSMKYLCNQFFQESNLCHRYKFPVLIRLRELDGKKGETNIIDRVLNTLGLNVAWDAKLDVKTVRNLLGIEEVGSDPEKDADRARNCIKEMLVVTYLDRFNALLILDGFDEITSKQLRENVISDVRLLSEKLQSSSFILTSRTADFIYNINRAVQFEICPLSNDQIKTFSRKWLEEEQEAEDFLQKVFRSPFADTSMRPLTLSLLCAIYERTKDIPEKPKTVYRKIVDLLIEEWDQQRSVKRSSSYGNFEKDRKFEFLCSMSYSLTTTLNKTTFSKSDLQRTFKHIYEDFNLKITESKAVVSEIESHTGLLVQSGYDEFEFAHKSLQEYLTAEYLVKLPTIPDDKKVLSKLSNELAIAVAISSSPSNYFVELVTNRLAKYTLRENYVKSFINRLLLEKPDFNRSNSLCISLLCLYSIYIQSNISSEGQLNLFNYDNIIQEFDSLMEIILKKSSFSMITDSYYKYGTLPLHNGENIIIFRHKAKHGKQKPPIYLPATIYVRESLINWPKASSSFEGNWVGA